MKGEEIPPTDNLALHCRQSAGLEIDPSGTPVSITSEAFRVDDDGISTTWIEFNGGDLQSTCLLLAAVMRIRKVHGIAKFNVGEIIDLANSLQRHVKAIHDPIDPPAVRPNPAHALIVGIAASDDDLLERLALLADLSLYSDEAIRVSKAAFPR